MHSTLLLSRPFGEGNYGDAAEQPVWEAIVRVERFWVDLLGSGVFTLVGEDRVLAEYARLAREALAPAEALAERHARAGRVRHREEAAHVAWRLERILAAAADGPDALIAHHDPRHLTRGLESDHGPDSDELDARLSVLMRHWDERVAVLRPGSRPGPTLPPA